VAEHDALVELHAALGVRGPLLGNGWTSGQTLATEVDLLIHDAQYPRAEYKSKLGWGHSAFEDTVELAGESGVEHLILFHHDPLRSDAQINQLVREARQIVTEKGWAMRVDAAREGMEVFLFPKEASAAPR
jgi:ribonuclease BN (tRNA processing enzyme)